LADRISSLVLRMVSTDRVREGVFYSPVRQVQDDFFITSAVATGWPSIASWLRTAAVGKHYLAYDYFLSALGRQAKWLAALLLRPAGERLGSRWLSERSASWTMA
jgi:hypothetical protein